MNQELIAVYTTRTSEDGIVNPAVVIKKATELTEDLAFVGVRNGTRYYADADGQLAFEEKIRDFVSD